MYIKGLKIYYFVIPGPAPYSYSRVVPSSSSYEEYKLARVRSRRHAVDLAELTW
jgi:hypothetical protein